MPNIKSQRETMIASGGLDSNSLLGKSFNGKNAKWIVSTDVVVALDAGKLTEAIADAVLETHRIAIEQGQRADGSGAQPDLDPEGAAGRAAKKGDRPSLRGVTATRKFPQGLRRGPIQFSAGKLASGRTGTRAKTRITGPPRLRGWLAKEALRGVSYFFIDGAIAALVESTLLRWTNANLLEAVPMSGPRERRGPMSGPKLPPMQGPKQQK